MRAILLKQKLFEVSTPLGKRDIIFNENLVDREFDSFQIENNTLLLRKDGITLATLSYNPNRNCLSGSDLRGGTTEVYPFPNKEQEFKNHFSTDRKSEPLLKEKDSIKKKTDTAVVCNLSFEGYDCYKPSKKLFDTFDSLFQAGYQYVMYINTPITPHITQLLENLSKDKVHGDIGSVQVVSGKAGKADEISLETGDWRSFSISVDVWAKIRKHMDNPKFNFFRNLTVQFKEKKLKRYSTNMSRDKDWTPQDSRRKNFKIVSN